MKTLSLASLLLLSSVAYAEATPDDWLQRARSHLAQGQTQAAIDAYSGALGISAMHTLLKT